MAYWRVPTAYSTASVQHQYAIDAHQHNATVSLTLRRRQTIRPPRRHRGDAVAGTRTPEDAHSTEQNRCARPSDTTVRAVGLHAAPGLLLRRHFDVLHRRAPLGERAQLRADGAAFVGRRRLFSVVGQRDPSRLGVGAACGIGARPLCSARASGRARAACSTICVFCVLLRLTALVVQPALRGVASFSFLRFVSDDHFTRTAGKNRTISG